MITDTNTFAKAQLNAAQLSLKANIEKRIKVLHLMNIELTHKESP
jgi:hypothetical protein